MSPDRSPVINPENKIGKPNSKKRFILKAAGALTAFTIILPPALHPENSIRVISALAGKDIDCTGGTEPQDPRYHADAIVVPGAGMDREKDGTLQPNEFGKIRLEAAAISYFNKAAPLIILLDGKTSTGEEQSAPVTYLQDLFKKLNGNDTSIPEKALVVEENSFNTATNMQELAGIAKDHKVKLVLIVTNDFHITRATLLACANGLTVVSEPAENIILQQSPERQAEIDSIRQEGRRQNRKEIPEIISQLWFPGGEIQVVLWKNAN